MKPSPHFERIAFGARSSEPLGATRFARQFLVGFVEGISHPLRIGQPVTIGEVALNPDERIEQKVVIVYHSTVSANPESRLVVRAAHVACQIGRFGTSA
jgi:hypothetical protein